MQEFPRTMVGGVSVPRLIIGTNWFLGYSHTSLAKDKFIKDFQNRKNVADIMTTFFEHGINAVMGMLTPLMVDAVKEAEDRTGTKGIMIVTPQFNIPGFNAGPGQDAEKVFDDCAKAGATFCFPHQCITDTLIDKMSRTIRQMDSISAMIRERDMIPGLSTHMPEAVQIADESGADVETYIQLYNAYGFLMQVEVDWVMKVIHRAKKPVMTIKPLAAGRLMPVVGLAYVWNTLRDIDMVTIGTTTVDEAKEVIDLSFDFLEKRLPDHKLQETRSKGILRELNK
ncbi:MAG TPA: hypothetical protein ENN32_06475 [Chloroflexi bacterium]|nr:hypothetical protein [Chloroflexota bacterium]